MGKTVCIVGAGPAGLVAAKTLIHGHPKGTFHVTVFEASHRIGGLWPVSEQDDGMVNPDMCTNQSRHCVAFSDLAWPDTVPSFPKAWQVGQYLERYVKTYPGYEIRRNCKVVKADLKNEKWKVQIRDCSASKVVEASHDFDYMIVSTGFFGKPKLPKLPDDFPVPVLHSSQVRDVLDVLRSNGKTSPSSERNIVIVGGQMSGVELAGSLALQLSSAETTPGDTHLPNAADYYITNVIQKPPWIMTLFYPKDPVLEVTGSDGEKTKVPNASPSFAPVDLITYNLAYKPPGPLQNTSGHITTEAAQITHGFMETYLGTDQSEFGPLLAVQGETKSRPVWLAVSDHYLEFVRSKKINILRGKVEASEANELLVKDGPDIHQLKDVAAVILATGFDASPSLDFLPQEVLETLQFEPTCDSFPLGLSVHSTINKAIPSLGFVGFYRSPYWGVIEMQARYLGAFWTGESKATAALTEDKTLESMLSLRTDPRRAQFPMGDYAYLMESFSDILGIKRSEPEGSTGRTGLVLPFRYLKGSASQEEKHEAATAISIVDKILADSIKCGKYVARAAFRAMQGDWRLHRTIESRIASYPSGTLSGDAYFKPRSPTEKGYDLEYLYLENGEFTADNGLKFTARRSYVYRYTESNDTLSAWFTKADHKTVDYLFHELEIIPPTNDADPHEPWRAKSSHLCVEDMYNVAYEFQFKGVGLQEWSLEYSVRGPAKDYTIKNIYRR